MRPGTAPIANWWKKLLSLLQHEVQFHQLKNLLHFLVHMYRVSLIGSQPAQCCEALSAHSLRFSVLAMCVLGLLHTHSTRVGIHSYTLLKLSLSDECVC
jgi:hypothetical protein